jgi:peroxiredoxin
MEIAKRLLGIAVASAAILGVIVLIAHKPPSSPLVGRRAPEFDMYSTLGQQVSLRDVTLQPTVMCFWRLRDPESMKALAALDTLARSQDELPGLVTAAINCDASTDEIVEFAKTHDFKFHILHMGDDAERLRKAATLYHLHSHELPRFFLVQAPDNRILADLEGPRTAEQLKQAVFDVRLLPWGVEDKQDGS